LQDEMLRGWEESDGSATVFSRFLNFFLDITRDFYIF
jgi:hypothetical protein